MISKIYNGELIGMHVRVLEAGNATLNGMEGKVVDESKNTVKLSNGKMLPKSDMILHIEEKGSTVRVVSKRPEDRI